MKKPVKIGAVVGCLVLVLVIVATLVIPVFSIKLNPVGMDAEYINVTGLDMIKALFSNGADFASQSTAVQKLYTFLGFTEGYTQYINPIFVVIMMWTYILCLGLSAVMLVFTIFNFAGRRFSVFNVFAGLLLFICGIVLVCCVVLQNGEFIINGVIEYNLRLSVGAILVFVVGFAYMMIAPKKRI